MFGCLIAKSGVSIETSARVIVENEVVNTDELIELNDAVAHLGVADQSANPVLVRRPWCGGQPDVRLPCCSKQRSTERKRKSNVVGV